MDGEARVFNRRPMALCALAFSAGILLCQNISGTRLIIAVCFFIAIAVLSGFTKRRGTLIAAAAIIAGLIRTALFHAIPPAPVQPGIFEHIREALCTRTDELFLSEAPLIKAMLFGDKEDMAYQALLSFRTAGIAHIFALSGLHVSFFVGALSFLLRRCSHPLRFCITSAFLLVYCAVCAFPASLVRASVMSVCLLFAPIAGRRADTVSSLSLSAIIILMFDPSQLFEAGFLMSFGAVLGIAFFARPFEHAFSFMGNAASRSVSVSLSAGLGVLPLSAYFFKRLPLFSLPANLLMLPLVPVTVLCGFAGVMLSFVWSAAAVPFVFTGGLFARVLAYVSGLVSGLPAASVEIPAFSPYLCAFFYILMLLLSPLTLSGAKGRVYMACAAASVLFVISLVV